MGAVAWRQMNHNLLLTFIFRVSVAVSLGLWNMGVGSTWIFLLEHKSNTLVGFVQGVQGIAIPLAALPAGYIADRWRRDMVLRALGVAAVAGCISIMGAVYTPQTPVDLLGFKTDLKYVIILVGMAFWGVAQASSPIVESILADSTPTGMRSEVYTLLFTLSTAAVALGPLTAAMLFLWRGNSWSINALGDIMLVGMALSLVPAACLFCFDDDKALGSIAEAHNGLPAEPASDPSKVDPEAAIPPKLRTGRFLGLSQAAIPYFMALSDCIGGLGAGMTIKFFPIFFAEEVGRDGMSPLAVNLMMTAMPLLIGAFSNIAQRLSSPLGRVQVIVGMRVLGVALMAAMGLFPGMWKTTWLVVAVYLLRTASSNCPYPISKSILMDFVPKHQRGKWNSVESIMIFGWSGSALLGGYLVDRTGYDITFVITAAMQALACLVLLPLLALVPRKEMANVAGENVDLHEALLHPDTSDAGETLDEAADEAAVPSSSG